MRKMRTIILVFVVGAGAALGWQLWLTTGYYNPVTWHTEEGGLILTYIPGKGAVSTSLIVGDGYVRGSRRTWVTVYPGATNRIIGAPFVPPPEDLFASVRMPMGKSDPIGLCNLYDDVGETQRQDIMADLQCRARNSPEIRDALQRLFDAGDHPWLAKVLHE